MSEVRTFSVGAQKRVVHTTVLHKFIIFRILLSSILSDSLWAYIRETLIPKFQSVSSRQERRAV